MTDIVPRTYDGALCVGCGLCCDGTLFTRGRIAEDEESAFDALGGELIREGRQAHFLQPCRFHSDGRCSIYASRWAVCRSFRCALLRRYQSGEIGLEDGRSTIERAFELIAAVRANDPAATIVSQRRRVRRQLAAQLEGGVADGDDSTARRLLNIVALDTFL